MELLKKDKRTQRSRKYKKKQKKEKRKLEDKKKNSVKEANFFLKIGRAHV